MPGYRHIVKNNYTLNAQKISKNENTLTDDFFLYGGNKSPE